MVRWRKLKKKDKKGKFRAVNALTTAPLSELCFYMIQYLLKTCHVISAVNCISSPSAEPQIHYTSITQYRSGTKKRFHAANTHKKSLKSAFYSLNLSQSITI